MGNWAEAMQNKPSETNPQLKPPVRTHWPKFQTHGETVYCKQVSSLSKYSKDRTLETSDTRPIW